MALTLQAGVTYFAAVRAECDGFTEPGEFSDTISFTTRCDVTETVGVNTAGYAGRYISNSFVPISTANNYSGSEQIYYSTDLRNTTGTIIAFDLYLNSSITIREALMVDIYMTHTSDSVMSQWVPTDSMEAVYSGPLNLQQGWNNISLSHQFHYNGNDNLIVAIVMTRNEYHAEISFGTYNVRDSITLYYASTLDTMTTNYALLSNRRDVTRFYICPEEVAICNPPTITSLTATDMSITVNYSAPSPCELHITQGWWNRGFNGEIDSNYTHTFDGLNPSTQYTVGLRQHCPDSTLSIWTIRRITTMPVEAYPPDSLMVDNVTFNSAYVSWRPHSSDHKWELRLFNSLTDIRVILTDTSYTFDELTSWFTYKVCLRSMCGSDYSILSNWGDTVEFTTDYCHPVSNITVNDITDSTARVSWNPSDNGSIWRVEYGYEGFSHGEALGEFTLGDATSVFLDSLEPGTTYNVVVAAVCDNQLMSVWRAAEPFTTTGLNDIELASDGSAFIVYPNPANSVVTIRLQRDDPSATIALLDQNGRIIAKRHGSTATLDVGDMTAGIYFVRTTVNDNSSVSKLIIAH